MTINEIKRVLRVEKPIAKLEYIRNGVAYYLASTSIAGRVRFEIPVSDMGSADFFPEMDTKHITHWIVGDYTPVEKINISESEFKEYYDLLCEDVVEDNPRLNELYDKIKSALLSRKDKFLEIIHSGKIEPNIGYLFSKFSTNYIFDSYSEDYLRYQTLDLNGIIKFVLEDYSEFYEDAKMIHEVFGKGSLTSEEYEDLDGRYTFSVESLINLMDEVIKYGVSKIQIDW